MFLLLALLILLLIYLFYRWATADYDYFEKRGIPFDKPFPLFGSLKDCIFRKTSMFDRFIELYNMHDGKIFGIFDQRKPVILVRDPELLKQITVKGFDHFINHRLVFDGDNDLFGSSLVSLRDAKWKDMRSTLSPVFTGSKLRQMFQLMNHVAEHTVEYLKQLPEINSEAGVEMDIKDFCNRFSSDIIASVAFGLDINSFKDKNNNFYTTGKKITTFSFWQNLKFLLYSNFKNVMKFLKIELFGKKENEYFMRLVLDAMKYRKENNIFRPDMIHMLMEARGIIKSDHPKSHSRDWTDVEIVAQCFIFFFAGFENIAVLACIAAHELMENPDAQQKLYEEIEEVCNNLEGEELTYEKIQGMKYLDMVISETLRKWPTAVITDRLCNKDFVYEADDGERIEIKKGEVIFASLSGFQRDPKYFENPNKFDPERFSDENKDQINPFTYLPFGVGPRNCIASRYALLETKALVFYLLRDFRIEASKKSSIPMKLNPASFTVVPKNGFWMKLISRT